MESRENKKLKSKLKLLSEKDLKFLTTRTGLSDETIKEIYNQFMIKNSDGKLNKSEFSNLMRMFEPNKPTDEVNKIMEYIFKAFDSDKNGSVDFKEFMFGYIMMSNEDNKLKFEYTFELYDPNGSGYLNESKIKKLVFQLIGFFEDETREFMAKEVAEEICEEFDKNVDGKISKEEFINGLLSNPDLAQMMSIF